LLGILPDLRPGEAEGIIGVGVKIERRLGEADKVVCDNVPIIPIRPPVAKALSQNGSDGEGRKLGERSGLDTRVVLAVNDTH
jgi:hypothetical protein